MSGGAGGRGVSVAVASDHGGFALKRNLLESLREQGYTPFDVGCHSADAVDYPDLARELALTLRAGRADLGVMIDAAGVGSTMALNRVRGIRAALCHDPFTTVNSRAHNNANVLVLGARVLHPGEARRLLRLWLATEFEGGRHERRVAKIDGLGDLNR